MAAETLLYGAVVSVLVLYRSHTSQSLAVVTMTVGLWVIAGSTGFLFPLTSSVAILMNLMAAAIAFTTAPAPLAWKIGVVSTLLSGVLAALEFVGRPIETNNIPSHIQTVIVGVFACFDSGLLFLILGRYVIRLHLSRIRLLEFRKQLRSTAEIEKGTLARELHDQVGGDITGIRLLLDSSTPGDEDSAKRIRQAIHDLVEFYKPNPGNVTSTKTAAPGRPGTSPCGPVAGK